MPHASLLGSNGHHSTFTSEMISGQINVFIVLFKNKKKRKKRNTHIHTHNADTRRLLHTHTHTYVYILVHTRLRDQNAIRQHTQVVCTYCSVCHTGASVQTHTQLKDQHHLEVRVRHCPRLTEVLRLLFVSPPPHLLWIEKCFLLHDLLHPMIVSP